MLSINAGTLASLPEEVRNAVVGNASIWHKRNNELLTEGAAAGIERCQKDFKATVTHLPDEQRRQWAKMLPPLALEWAKTMDAQGRPGTPILNDYMNAMRASNEPVMRDWDRE
jgi:TRAP-type C4-dicarboxylate transport system substrate-binding protein